MSVVDVNTEGLGDLSRALTKKRLDCMKLLEALNAPPRGLADLMAQSRAFTDKLNALLEDGSELSDSIKNELVDDNGFPGHVRRLPLEDIYNDVARVKEELRISDGYQPYLVAPEAGLRAIFEKSIGTLSNPVRDLVDSVHGIVTMAADRAIKESCQVPALERGPPVVRFPHFIEHILPVANMGLEELKAEAMKTAVRMVEMEQCFVSCSFFRYLTFKRIKEQEEALKQRDTTNRRGRGTGEEEDEEDEEDSRSVAETEEKTERRHGPVEGDVGLQAEHGLGSSVFWDPICRDVDNSLLPSPGILLEDDTELSMEKALMQHAADMKVYTRLACETLVMTVPKVIVHLLVDKSSEKLGPRIEEYILRLPEEDKNMLLEEDVGIAGHRRQVQDLVSDIGKAQQRLKEAERAMGESASAKIDISIIEKAGLSARLKENEEGVYVFINRPKPPAGKRNVTPEKKRDVPPQVPARPQPPAAAQPGIASRGSLPRTAKNGSNQPAMAPKRPAPPVASTSANRSAVPPQSGAPNGNAAIQSQQQSGNKSQQPKPAQSGGWYGFKPFSRS